MDNGAETKYGFYEKDGNGTIAKKKKKKKKIVAKKKKEK